MELDARQTVIVAILVLFLGRIISQKVAFFRHYNIPEPVLGGLTVSIILSIIYFLFDFTFEFALRQRDILLIVFFTCVGLSSRFSMLLKGGRALVILLILAVSYLFLQNFTGVAVMELAGLPPYGGVLGGSVSLSGGHGTAIAWAPTFINDYGIKNAMEIGIACATFGLVLGGIIGGPIANYLITRYQLKATSHEKLSVGIADEHHQKITVDSVFSTLLVLALAIGLGLHLHALLDHLGVKLPVFVPCLFGGILLTNTIPYLSKKIPWPTGTPTMALISDLSLGLFLAMSLMSLQLWTLIALAGPILVLLAAQVIVVTLFTIFVIFRALGKDYDAAIMSAGYAGLALGATPTAIVNMTAVTKQYGSSPQAFIVIPLIGAFFIDIANSVIIQNLLRWIS